VRHDERTDTAGARSGAHQAVLGGRAASAFEWAAAAQGYISVDPNDRRIVVSGRIREEFENGRDYYQLHGRPLARHTIHWRFLPASIWRTIRRACSGNSTAVVAFNGGFMAGNALSLDDAIIEIDLSLRFCERGDDPVGYLLLYKGRVLAISDDDEFPVGEVQALVAQFPEADEAGWSAFDVLDSLSRDTACYLPLIGGKNVWCARIMNRFEPWEDRLLILDRVLIDPRYRGHYLGLKAAHALIDRLSMGCGMVALQPAPLVYPKLGATAEPMSRSDEEELKESRRKLFRYWSLLGFRPYGKSGLMVLGTAFKRPSLEEVLERARTLKAGVARATGGR
jgi:hypothetical protein